MSALPVENAWQRMSPLEDIQVRIGPRNQFTYPTAFGISGSRVDSVGKFRGQLRIHGVQFTIPEQDFTVTKTDSGITFQNEPEGSWPRVSFVFASQAEQDTYKFEEYLVGPSDRTVDGAILFSRVLFFLSKAYKCSLVTSDSGEIFNADLLPFSKEQIQGVFTIAKLARKLKYIQNVFNVEFLLPRMIPSSEFRKAEIVFRGITEGEFTLRATDFTFIEVPPLDINLTKPPFEGCGTLSRKIEDQITLFGKQLLVGPVIVHLDKAELASPKVVDHIRKGLTSPIDVRFEVLDNQITYRFESYMRKSRSQQMQRLNRFKHELAQQEQKELVDLVDESLQNDVSSDEAVQIAVGWTQYNDLPDRYCPQEPELDSDSEHWRVPIYLIYANGEGGPVGELIIDVKTGEIVSHTPIEEIRSKGLALAEQILHA